jgi:hypothetical protein
MTHKFAGLLLAILPFTAIPAQEKFDPQARAKIIAPFLDEQTVGVIHVDLTRLDVDRLFAELGRFLPLSKERLAANQPHVRELHAAAVRAGVKELYVTFASSELPNGFVVIPLAPGVDEKAVREALPGPAPTLRGPGDQRRAGPVLERRGDVLVGAAGNPKYLARLAGMTPDPRPELATALEALGDTAVQAVYLPPKYFRRVIEETMPELPKPLGGGSSKLLTQGVLWAAVGIDVAPRTAVRLVIQSQDAAAAQALQTRLVELMRAATQLKEVRAYLPKSEEAIGLLTPKVEGDRLTLTLDEANQGISRALAVLTPPLDVARARATRQLSANHLKQLAIAMQNYHDTHKQFPLPGTLGPDKKPLLSWRVQILPFVEQMELYKQFKLDEPWDSAHNRTLIDKMPEVYRLPVSKKGSGWTNYVLPVGNGAGFVADVPTVFKEIRDGTSNTIMIVEVDDEHAVIWTKPEDWSFDPQDPAKGLGQFFDGGRHIAFFDGSVRWIAPSLAPDTLRALFTRAGREAIPSF